MLHGSLKKLALVGSVMALFAAIAASSASAAPLEVETQAATNVGSYSATLNGRVSNPFGGDGLAGYEYGTTTSYGNESNSVVLNGKKGWIDVPITIEGLQPNTTYHFRFAAVTNPTLEISYGEDFTFTTLPKAKFLTDNTSDYPLDLSLSSDSSDPISFGIEGGQFTCSSLTASGSITAGDVLFGKSAAVALSPSFGGCTALGLTEASVSTNGCTFVVHAGDSGTATGAIDVACPAGQAIEVTAVNCKFSITAQTGLSPVSETDVPGAGVDIEVNAGGLNYVKTKDGMLCPFNGTGAKSDGTLTGSAGLTGTHEGAPVPVSIGH